MEVHPAHDPLARCLIERPALHEDAVRQLHVGLDGLERIAGIGYSHLTTDQRSTVRGGQTIECKRATCAGRGSDSGRGRR